MTGFLEMSDLAQAASFRTRLLGCIVKVAGTVIAEDVSEKAGPEANKRLILAQLVLRDPQANVSSFVWPVLSNPSIATAGLATSDGDLEYQVTQIWNAVAGVTHDDKIKKPPVEVVSAASAAIPTATPDGATRAEVAAATVNERPTPPGVAAEPEGDPEIVFPEPPPIEDPEEKTNENTGKIKGGVRTSLEP